MAKDAKGVIWLSDGWYAVNIGFCPTKKIFYGLRKSLGMGKDKGGGFYPKGKQACAHRLICRKTGIAHFIVTVADGVEKTGLPQGIAAALAHEAAHVWQYIKAHIGEESPGAEQEAYAIQGITLELIEAFEKSRGTLFLKKAGRATHELKA